jgi:DNA-binding transcriptional LysR family regulator
LAETPAVAQLLNRLRLRQVALLLELQATGTLRAAAARLGMTQPAATKMLHALESTLGCALFERRGRGLQPTAAGRAVVEHFHGLRGSIAALSRDLQALREGGGGRLAVGHIMASSPVLLTRAVARLKTEQPQLALAIVNDTSDRLLERLDRGELDIVIGRLVEGYERHDYQCEDLDAEALAVVVRPQHPRAKARRVTLAELAGEPWILQPRGSPMRELLEQEFRQQRLDSPPQPVETGSILTTLDLVAETDMVAVIPASVAARHGRHGLLTVLPLRLTQQMEPYGSIVRRDRPQSAAAERLLVLLREAAAGASAPAQRQGRRVGKQAPALGRHAAER